MCAVYGAVEIGLLGPLHIVGDYEVEFAVAVVVHPRGAGRKFVRSPHSSGPCDIGECSIAVVVEQMTLAQRGDEEIVKPVVVVITHRNSQSEHRNRESRLPRHIGERAIAVVVVELQSCGAGVSAAGKISSIDKNDVGIPVVVVVDKRAARPHGLRQPFLAEGAVVVSEMDSGLGCDVAKVNLRVTRCRQEKQYQPRRHGGTENAHKKVVAVFSVSRCLRGELP